MRKHLKKASKQAFKRGKKNCPRVSFVFYGGKVMGSDMTEGKVECWPFLLIKISPRSFLKVECKSERVRWPFSFVFQEPSRPFLYRSDQSSGATKLCHEAMLMVTNFVGLNRIGKNFGV